MSKSDKIGLTLTLLVILIAVVWFIYLFTHDGEKANINPSGGEYVTFNVKCECGNNIITGMAMTAELWPLIYNCGECYTEYIITKEPK